MDIAALSIDVQQTRVQQSAGISILKEAMDSAGNNAAALIKMMEQSVQPQLGSNVDVEG